MRGKPSTNESNVSTVRQRKSREQARITPRGMQREIAVTKMNGKIGRAFDDKKNKIHRAKDPSTIPRDATRHASDNK